MAAALAAGFAVAGCMGSDDEEPKQRTRDARAPADAPNFVVIQSDDQSLEMMRVMRRTNRLLGARGATFTNHFANWPLCCPSRATQLTGQYAHNHGVLGNAPPEGGYLQLSRHDNIAVWLKEAGYEVGHVGKFLNGYGPKKDDPETPKDDVTEVPRGWSDWRTGSAGTTYGYYDYVQNEWSEEDGAGRDGELVDYGHAPRDFKTDVNTRDALDLIAKYSEGRDPFYLQVDYLAPHSGGPNRPENTPHPPYDCRGYAKAAPRHAAAFDSEPLAAGSDPSFNEPDVSDKPEETAAIPRLGRAEIASITAGYRCELESMLGIDEGVARIVRRLEDTGELENTFVIFMSDNGYLHGEHRLASGKNHVYEPSVRLALLVRGPGIPAGAEVRDLTVNADFAPTVMALAGAEFDDTSPPDGQSLLPPAERPWEETGRALLIETNGYAAVRTQRYKWVEHEGGSVELYDLKRDASEEQNVAADPGYADARARLEERLAALRECAADDCRDVPAIEFDYATPDPDGCPPRMARARVSGADADQVARVATRRIDRATVEARASLMDGRRVVRRHSYPACG